MKRRINIEQLAELTGEQVRKLHDWWQPSIGDWMINTNLVKPEPRVLKYTFKHERDLPLLDIGQMIELLQDNDSIIRYEPDEQNELQIYKEGQWGRNTYYVSLLNKDICDALWRAVKQIL
jgi:hypothetical protein